MAFEHKEGKGSLFKNTKRTADNQPNARGDAMIGGVLYEISAWTKKKADGEPYQSLAIKPKDARPPTRAETAQTRDAGYDDPSDDIPF